MLQLHLTDVQMAIGDAPPQPGVPDEQRLVKVLQFLDPPSGITIIVPLGKKAWDMVRSNAVSGIQLAERMPPRRTA